MHPSPCGLGIVEKFLRGIRLGRTAQADRPFHQPHGELVSIDLSDEGDRFLFAPSPIQASSSTSLPLRSISVPASVE